MSFFRWVNRHRARKVAINRATRRAMAVLSRPKRSEIERSLRLLKTLDPEERRKALNVVLLWQRELLEDAAWRRKR